MGARHIALAQHDFYRVRGRLMLSVGRLLLPILVELAEQAVQRQFEVCAPLVGNSARSRYLSLRLRELEGHGNPHDAGADDKRLAAIEQAV